MTLVIECSVDTRYPPTHLTTYGVGCVGDILTVTMTYLRPDYNDPLP